MLDELRELAEEAGDPEQLADARFCGLTKLLERFELDRFDAEYARAEKAATELRQPAQRWLVAVMRPMYGLLAPMRRLRPVRAPHLGNRLPVA